MPQQRSIRIIQDYTAAIDSSKIALSCTRLSRLQYINDHLYNIRELVSTQQVRPVQCSTTDQHADICTKTIGQCCSYATTYCASYRNRPWRKFSQPDLPDPSVCIILRLEILAQHINGMKLTQSYESGRILDQGGLQSKKSVHQYILSWDLQLWNLLSWNLVSKHCSGTQR